MNKEKVSIKELEEDFRYVYGTRDKKWYLISPDDRDWKYGITEEEMKRLGKKRAREKYLRAVVI